ncbi:hypothetical protein Tco_0378889, partial [Tanacetum coccineum]
LLRRVESRIRLCTHAKRQGRERDSRNAAWPGPTNGKEGRWRVEVGDKVMLEVSSWKDVVHFRKKEMLAPRYKYLTDTNLHVHLEEIKVDKTLRFIEEPIEIIDREVKSLKRSRIPIVKSIETRSEVVSILVGRGFLATCRSILNTKDRVTSTFDGIFHQTFRVAQTSVITEESDSDDEEEYSIKRNNFGAPIYGPNSSRYLNGKNLMDRALALQEVLNPFKKICVWKKAIGFLRSLPVLLQHLDWKPIYSRNFYRKDDRDGQWHAEIRLTDPYGNIYDQGFVTKKTSKKLSKYHNLSDVMSPDVLNKMDYAEEIENMLEIKVYKAGSQEKIFSSEAWRRAFVINESIYTELCHEFYSTYEFDEVCADDELRTKKVIKFRLYGRVHSLTLLEFARRLDYWLRISTAEELHLSRSLASTIRSPILRVLQKMITYGLCQRMTRYDKLITKIAKKMRVLTDEVLNSLSAPTYCRALDTTTLRELIDSEGRLIPKVPAPGVPRVFPEAQDHLRRIYMTEWVAWRFVRERLRGWLISSHITRTDIMVCLCI